MGLWLDHKLFGNGRGLKSPYFNDTYFWLRDEMRPQSKGRLYTWMGCGGNRRRTWRDLRQREWTVYGVRPAVTAAAPRLYHPLPPA